MLDDHWTALRGNPTGARYPLSGTVYETEPLGGGWIFGQSLTRGCPNSAYGLPQGGLITKECLGTETPWCCCARGHSTAICPRHSLKQKHGCDRGCDTQGRVTQERVVETVADFGFEGAP